MDGGVKNCSQGHEMSEGNVSPYRKAGHVYYTCRACARDRSRIYYYKKKEGIETNSYKGGGKPKHSDSVAWTPFRGVQYTPANTGAPYTARVGTNIVGSYPTALSAARAYDKIAKIIYKDRAILNFPESK